VRVTKHVHLVDDNASNAACPILPRCILVQDLVQQPIGFLDRAHGYVGAAQPSPLVLCVGVEALHLDALISFDTVRA
jgi:hypothetical protein